MVFYGVVSAAREETGDGGPLVTKAAVGPDDGLVFLGREGTVLHLRRELVAPAKPARLARSARDRFADQRPVPGTMLLDQPLQRLIFLWAPRSLYSIQVLRSSTQSHWIHRLQLLCFSETIFGFKVGFNGI